MFLEGPNLPTRPVGQVVADKLRKTGCRAFESHFHHCSKHWEMMTNPEKRDLNERTIGRMRGVITPNAENDMPDPNSFLGRDCLFI